MSLPWFRMYAEFAGDPVIQSLAFEDQRHYVVILCLKCNGTLDRNISADLIDRIVLRGLGLDPVAGAEAKRRLMEVCLIEKNWQPKGWDKRQFRSDLSTERVRQFRKRSETVSETDQIQIQIQNRTDIKSLHAKGSRKNGAHHERVDDSPVIETLPILGGSFEVRQSLVAELEPLCPAVDIVLTLREMKLWLVGNPERQKTRKGIRRFISGWLSREQQKAESTQARH